VATCLAAYRELYNILDASFLDCPTESQVSIFHYLQLSNVVVTIWT